MRSIVIVIWAVLLASSSSGQFFEARLSAEPPLHPDEIARLEAAVRTNPADKATRLKLLRHYRRLAPAQSAVRPPHQADRLRHILYLVENFPSDPVSSSILTYVPAENGPYADGADHAAVRHAWTAAVDRLPEEADVQLNAARFLHRQHPEDAEELLRRAVDRQPTNRRLAANLGFLYALDVLSIGHPGGRPSAGTQAERDRLRDNARRELDRSRNPLVIAGAGIALPNLFPRTDQSRIPDAGTAVFELATRLLARARELDVQGAELHGPMPLIKEFQEFQQADSPEPSRPESHPKKESALVATDGAGTPSTVRVGGTVQSSKMVEKPEAVYPAEALTARIEGVVRFNVVISPEGTVTDATLISGHPLLVPPAAEAIRRYRYLPTLLNGSPVQVISQVEVLFTLPK